MRKIYDWESTVLYRTGVERPKHDVSHLAASSSEIENESSCTLTLDKSTVKCRK